MRRVTTFLLALMLLASLVPITGVGAAAATVTGTLVTKSKIALTSAAVSVITVVDQQAGSGAGAIIGQQRVTGGQLPVAFAVPYDTARVASGHSFALFATIVDGTQTYQSVEPVPVITGGPTSGVTVTVSPLSAAATARAAGTITRADKTALSATAVAIAALIRQDTGTLVARQVLASVGSGAIAFAIPYDPGVVNPSATYVVSAAIVDGTRSWQSSAGVPAIVNGAPTGSVTVAVVLLAGPAPTAAPTAKPTAAPTAKPTAAPTEKPTAAPTAKPTEKPTEAPTPKPTAAPTAKPTAAPTAKPTAAPTEQPTAAPPAKPTAAPTAPPTAAPTPVPTAAPTPTPTPTPTPAATPSPTPSPTTGVIRGTLTYGESHELTAEARAVVLLVEGTAGPREGTIIASTSIADPGPQPVKFELAYPMSAVSEGSSYRLYAGIADGDLAWVTPIGVVVKVPAPLVEGIELPLAFRPDLLKAAVGGTIAGVGVDPARDPSAYGTAIIIRVDTGETVGFQLITPTGAAPVPFEVPYDPKAIDPNADYVVRGSIWDGTALWATQAGVPVITRDNSTSNVVMTVTFAQEPFASPSPGPVQTATPAPSPEVPPADSGGPGILTILVILGLAVLGVVGLLAWFRSRS